ncbi:HpcH/HpaI aldolase/citrate lyase family protein [Nocardia inohanensis]|uniref:HpcH/HpaI aldolase/citrate lyase family protein n=1 Tax=Nocardia inohanensis TaxID=209246 RepID=UPI000837270C|nr:CoA ester lyase [Nocardia inohanensis]
MGERIARSALYVPGNKPELFDKAVEGPADVILLDLEDSVPPPEKETARATVATWLREAAPAGRRLWVRVNAGELGYEDLRAVALPATAAICLAKTESAQQITAASALLDKAGPPAAEIRLCPLLESASAVFAAREIAAAPRVLRLQVGEADLRAELAITPAADERELLFLRSQIVLASAAAGIVPPLGPARTDYRDLDALRASTLALSRLGFRGRSCIHPAQVPIVNKVFTPTAADLERAQNVVNLFEAANGGVVLDPEGRMVDLAVIRHAQRLLGDGKAHTDPP